MKTTLLTALTSLKRVGDLQALSVYDTSLEFRPVDCHNGPVTPARQCA